ncbi:hypothetical protein SSYRP_v1c00510 [Spiroplasma syrphidicola EA-1]|uniref:Uncharacterized protein n=1 Tax=Spiroplasma syrphidicola EA-1 TaxID=1276229 RepID=R4U2R2_9MOLU|nr:hypothetical protein [Spiroplasma syrphidicola]AGM25647.1 hypothetical protein SSYRP_v1c00510 [Spiroplasma syrphidicola EA-1]
MKEFNSNTEVTDYIIKNFLNQREINLNEFIVFLGSIRLNNKRLNRKNLINELLENNIIFFISHNSFVFWKNFNFQLNLKLINLNINNYMNDFEKSGEFPFLNVCDNTLVTIYKIILQDMNIDKKFRNTYFLYSLLKKSNCFNIICLSQIWNKNFSFLVIKKDTTNNLKDLYTFLIKQAISKKIIDEQEILFEIYRVIDLQLDQYLVKQMIQEEIKNYDNNR